MIEVEVTQEDILSAIELRKNPPKGYLKCTHCPVALALKRKFPGCEIKVFEPYVVIDNTTYDKHNAESFILQFDRTGNAMPMTVKIW
jgi:hypothetical protein